jgi:hypothetical protein
MICLTCNGSGFINAHLIPPEKFATRRGLMYWVYCSMQCYKPLSERVRICPCCGSEHEKWWTVEVPGHHRGKCKEVTYESKRLIPKKKFIDAFKKSKEGTIAAA